ncbi:MAG: histidine kinase [Calditrichaeota bacterium]|nr:MAG: histidine kinase [Calditrichota bacterium]
MYSVDWPYRFMLKKVYPHIIFWLIIAGINIGSIIFFLPLKIVLQSTLFVLIFQVFVFYFNAKVLFPRFFSPTNNIRFILMTAAFILVVALCQSLIDHVYISRLILKELPLRRSHPHVMMIFMRTLFWLLSVDMISTVFMLQDRIRRQVAHTQQIKAEKLITELKLLKAQINPHFIFNALNNIYSLAYIKSEKAPESILKLSQMLRYVIEECEEDQVTIASEIEYIENYIAFQKMKSPNEQNIRFDHSHAELDVRIAPMLFIPFIENAFKYSMIEELADAFINVELRANQKEIVFEIANSIPTASYRKPGPGTGIENVRKRLQILFPQKHLLQINADSKEFRVHLSCVRK